jgi:hypothetical protein
MANKRMKIDRADNQLLKFSISNNHSIVQQDIAITVDNTDHTWSLQTAAMQEHTTIVKNLTR